VVAVGVALLLAMIVLISVGQHEIDALRHDGVRAVAVVTRANDTSNFLGVTTKQITVRFHFGDTTRSTVIEVDHPAPRFHEGERVAVYVDPANPAHLLVAGTENTSAARQFVTYLCFWLWGPLLPVGIAMLIRFRRFAKVLRAGKWQPVPSADLRFPAVANAVFRSYREPPTTFRMAAITSPRGVLRLAGSTAWSCRATSRGRAVLSIRDGSELFSFRTARTAWGGERLNRRFDQTWARDPATIDNANES
jgi:hypothetical protein